MQNEWSWQKTACRGEFHCEVRERRRRAPQAESSSQHRAKRMQDVYLNVYDLNPVNDNLFPLGLGAYHSGVEINGQEYTFAGGAGIFSHGPKQAQGARFRCRVLIGRVSITSRELQDAIDSMRPQWPGNSYHVMRKNCNSFSEALCQKLMGRSIPGWVNRLAWLGNRVSCLIPERMFGAPEGAGGGRGGGGGEDEDGEGSGGRSFLVHAPPGRKAGNSGSTGGSKAGVALSNGNGTSFMSRGGAAAVPGAGAAAAASSSSAAAASRAPAPAVGGVIGGASSSGGGGGAAARPDRNAMLQAALKRAAASGGGGGAGSGSGSSKQQKDEEEGAPLTGGG